MTINTLSNFRLSYFLDRVFEGEGFMPDSLSDIDLGYYMGRADIEPTEGNIKQLKFILANWPLFVEPEEKL